MTPCSSSSTYAVNPKPTMISPTDRKTPIKMAGYLEKKSKMRVVCRWKKLWFVLEGRLLLYYKSQLEYLSLSPCRGTVNMGLAASVAPGKSNEIIVSTRSHTVSLRALSRGDHDIWLQALMDAMCMPNASNAVCCAKPVHHFRYSTGGIDHTIGTQEVIYNIAGNHANTISGQLSPIYVKTAQNVNNSVGASVLVKSKALNGRDNVPEDNSCVSEVCKRNDIQSSLTRGNSYGSKEYKVDRLGKRFSKVGAVSDTSIPGKFKVTSNESMKANLPRRSLSAEEEVNRFTENIYESLKDVNNFETDVGNNRQSRCRRVNRSDSDCLMLVGRERMNKTKSQFRSEQRIKTSNGSPTPMYERLSETFYCRKPEKIDDSSVERMWKLKMKYSNTAGSSGTRLRRNYEKEAKSDTDLSILKHRTNIDQKTYGALYKTAGLLNRRTSESYDFSNLQEIIKEKTRGPVPLPGPLLRPLSSKTNRSNSILRTLRRMRASEKTSSNDMVKRNSLKKRSLSFLKRVWRRKEESVKWEEDSFSSEINRFYEMQAPNSDFDNMSDFSTNDLSPGYDIPQPEPPPDYDRVHESDDEALRSPPELPPRHRSHGQPSSSQQTGRSTSPCPHHHFQHNETIINSNKTALIEGEPPELPVKMRKLYRKPPPLSKNSNALDFLFYENSDPGLRYLFQEEEDYIVQDEKKNTDSKELDGILLKLNEMNSAPLTGFQLHENGDDSSGARRDNKDAEDPDYDIPRPHLSLLSNLRKHSSVSDSLPATNFFSHYEDSLDVTIMRDRFEDFTMAPDSLECDPWLLNNETAIEVVQQQQRQLLHQQQGESWSLTCDLGDEQSKSITDGILTTDSPYHDSLNHRLNDYLHLPSAFIQLHT